MSLQICQAVGLTVSAVHLMTFADIRELQERYFGDASGKKSAAAKMFAESVYAVLSVSSSIEFLQQYGVFPQVGDYRFIILHDAEAESFRIVWAAFFADGMVLSLVRVVSGSRVSASR